ncbi:MAG TPA: hypothetical protein GXX40_09245 [Firmicutes bacterium]|nr:hypothetical protein [Bacillota bacterium]
MDWLVELAMVALFRGEELERQRGFGMVSDADTRERSLQNGLFFGVP